MSKINDVVQRAISDAAFRTQLRSDPAKALRGFNLSSEETKAIVSGDPAKLVAFGVDQRMSKLFTVDGTGHSMHTTGDVNVGAGSDALISGGTNVHAAYGGGLSAGHGEDILVTSSSGDDAHSALQPGLTRDEGMLVTPSSGDDAHAALQPGLTRDEGLLVTTDDDAHSALQTGLNARSGEDKLVMGGDQSAATHSGAVQFDGGAYIDPGSVDASSATTTNPAPTDGNEIIP